MSNTPVFKKHDFTLDLAVWQNTGKNGNFHSVTLARSYKDKAGDYQTTKISLGRQDLLAASELLREAYHKIGELQAGMRGQETGEDDAR